MPTRFKHLILVLVLLASLFCLSCKNQLVVTSSDRAMALVDNAMYNQAIPLLEEQLAKTPDDPLLLRYYGFALRANADTNETPAQSCERMKKAIEIWKKWISVQPTTEGLIGVGVWYCWIGEYDSSLVYLRRSIDLKPRDTKHQEGEEEYRIAQTFFLMKQPDSVQVYMDASIAKGYPAVDPVMIANPCKLAELLDKYKDNLAVRDSLAKRGTASFDDSMFADSTLDSSSDTTK